MGGESGGALAAVLGLLSVRCHLNMQARMLVDSWCCGLNVNATPPSLYVEVLTSKNNSIRNGAFGQCLNQP